MNTDEMIKEIDNIKVKLALYRLGSIERGDLMIALQCLQDSLIRALLKEVPAKLRLVA